MASRNLIDLDSDHDTNDLNTLMGMLTVRIDSSEQVLLQAHRLERRGDLYFLARLKRHPLALVVNRHLGGIRCSLIEQLLPSRSSL